MTRRHDYETGFTMYGNGIIFGGDPDTLIDVNLPEPPDERIHKYTSIGDVNEDGIDDLMLNQSYRNDRLDMSISAYSLLLCGDGYDTFANWYVANDTLHELEPTLRPMGF